MGFLLLQHFMVSLSNHEAPRTIGGA